MRNDLRYLSEPAQTALELAFSKRRRQRCSKEDFADGFIAALRWLGVYEKYRLPRGEWEQG